MRRPAPFHGDERHLPRQATAPTRLPSNSWTITTPLMRLRDLLPGGPGTHARTGGADQISNLIAILTAIDAAPVATALGLGTSDVTVTRE